MRAAKEVILSAGSINSPQIRTYSRISYALRLVTDIPTVMLSGIGNATQLSSMGIKPLVNLPVIGTNLQVRRIPIRTIATMAAHSIHSISAGPRFPWQLLACQLEFHPRRRPPQRDALSGAP